MAVGLSEIINTFDLTKVTTIYSSTKWRFTTSYTTQPRIQEQEVKFKILIW